MDSSYRGRRDENLEALFILDSGEGAFVQLSERGTRRDRDESGK